MEDSVCIEAAKRMFRGSKTITKQDTVEPRLTATPLIRTPRYYGHSFLARQKGHTFAYKKTPLMRSPVNTANGHFFKTPNSDNSL